MEEFVDMIREYSNDELLRFAYLDACIECDNVDILNKRIDAIEDEIIVRSLSNAGLIKRRNETVMSYLKAGEKANDLFSARRIAADGHHNAAIDLEKLRELTEPYDDLWFEKPAACALLNEKYEMALPEMYIWGKNEEINFYNPENGVSFEVLPSATKISEIIIDKETDEENIVVSFWKDDRFVNTLMPADVAFSTAGTKQLTRKGAMFPPAEKDSVSEYLFKYYRQFHSSIKQRFCVNSIGWVDDTFSAFVPYAEDISYANASDYPGEFKSLLRAKGTLEDWKNMIVSYRDDKHIPFRIIIATSFASVLAKPLSGLCFLLHVWGPSGQGKSVALRTAASVWADSDLNGNKYIKSFRTTCNGLELAAQFYGNLPFCIDELQTHITPGHDNCDDLVYALAEGSPKLRGTGTGGLRTQGGWTNSIITTGEQPINSTGSMAGSLNRVIDINFSGALIEEDKVAMSAYCDKLAECYGTAGRFFISKLIEEGSLEKAKVIYKEYESQLNMLATGKQTSSAALILTADRLVSEWLFGDENCLQKDNILPYLKSEEDLVTNEKIHEYIIQYIARNPLRFSPDTKNNRYGQVVDRQGQSVYAFLPTMLETVVKEAGGNLRAYIAWAKDKGKLATDGSRDKIAVSMKNIPINEAGDIGTKTVRCYGIIYTDENA